MYSILFIRIQVQRPLFELLVFRGLALVAVHFELDGLRGLLFLSLVIKGANRFTRRTVAGLHRISRVTQGHATNTGTLRRNSATIDLLKVPYCTTEWTRPRSTGCGSLGSA